MGEVHNETEMKKGEWFWVTLFIESSSVVYVGRDIYKIPSSSRARLCLLHWMCRNTFYRYDLQNQGSIQIDRKKCVVNTSNKRSLNKKENSCIVEL